MHATERNHTRDPATGPHDHLSADLLAKDPVRRADIAGCLGSHGRRLEPETVFTNRAGRLVDDLVAGCAPVLEREVEPGETELDPDHGRIQQPQRRLQ